MSHPLTPDTLLDITHEALLRNWDKLQQWAYEEHEREIILREMLAQLDKWLKNNRDTQYLLSAGSLSYFEKWWNGIEVNKAMWMRRYLDGGIRADDLADKERKTQNAKQKKQEIEEYISDSRNYHNRKKRIQRIAIGIICVLLVTAVGGLIYSWDLKNKISVISHSNAIATKAYRTLEKDPTLAFRLAEQAYKIAPEPLAKEVLMAAYGEMPFYQVLRGHTEPIVNAKYSSDGKLIITACLDNTIKLWNSNGKLIYSIDKHTPLVSGSRSDVVNFSPNNKFIVSAGDDSTARLWEVSSGKCLAIMKHKRAVSSAVFSPDGTKILTASADKTAKLWDITGSELLVLKHYKRVSLAKYSHNGNSLMTISGDTVGVWEPNGRIKFLLTGHKQGISDAVFSSDDKLIATGSHDNTSILWDSLGQKLNEFHQDGYIYALSFSNDNKYLATTNKNNTIHLWVLTNGEEKIIRDLKATPWSVTFSKDDNLILSASDDGTARLWDLNGTELMVLKGHTDQVLSANFSPDGNYVVTASGDKTARIWNIKPKENPMLKGHTAEVFDANFSPDGKYVVTAAWDYSARLWNGNGSFLTPLVGHEKYTVYSGKILNNIILTNSGDGTIRLWDFSGNQIKKIKTTYNRANNTNFILGGSYLYSSSDDDEFSIIWSREGDTIQKFNNSKFLIFSNLNNQYLISVGMDSTYSFWLKNNLKEKEDSLYKFKFKHKNTSGNIISMEFSPEDISMVMNSEDSTSKIFEIGGKLMISFKGHFGPLTSIQYSPDGNHLLTISQDNTVGIWDREGKSISFLKGHNDIIQDANFSPDSKLIVTSSNDNTVRLWDLDGNEQQVYTNHKSAVSKAKFSPDGKYILSSSYDHTARIMPVSVEMVLDKINKEKVRGEVMELSGEELKVFDIKK